MGKHDLIVANLSYVYLFSNDRSFCIKFERLYTKLCKFEGYINFKVIQVFSISHKFLLKQSRPRSGSALFAILSAFYLHFTTIMKCFLGFRITAAIS